MRQKKKEDLTVKNIVSLTARHIQRQFPNSIPEARRLFAVFEQALMDAFIVRGDGCSDYDSKSARKMLREGNMNCIIEAGVDPLWIQRVINKAGLWELIGEKR